jgi:hypothetical protein
MDTHGFILKETIGFGKSWQRRGSSEFLRNGGPHPDVEGYAPSSANVAV